MKHNIMDSLGSAIADQKREEREKRLSILSNESANILFQIAEENPIEIFFGDTSYRYYKGNYQEVSKSCVRHFTGTLSEFIGFIKSQQPL